jgi:hypothetical protein
VTDATVPEHGKHVGMAAAISDLGYLKTQTCPYFSLRTSEKALLRPGPTDARRKCFRLDRLERHLHCANILVRPGNDASTQVASQVVILEVEPR